MCRQKRAFPPLYHGRQHGASRSRSARLQRSARRVGWAQTMAEVPQHPVDCGLGAQSTEILLRYALGLNTRPAVLPHPGARPQAAELLRYVAREYPRDRRLQDRSRPRWLRELSDGAQAAAQALGPTPRDPSCIVHRSQYLLCQKLNELVARGPPPRGFRGGAGGPARVMTAAPGALGVKTSVCFGSLTYD